MRASGSWKARSAVLGGEQIANGRHVRGECGQVTWDDQFDDRERTHDDRDDDESPLHSVYLTRS